MRQKENKLNRQEAGCITGCVDDKEIARTPVLLEYPASLRAACVCDDNTLQVFYDIDTALVKGKVCLY